MRILRTSAALTAAALVGLAFAGAAPAGASTNRVISGLHVANASSTAQAGYEVTSAPATSSASANFTVPAITGCTSTNSGIAAGSLIFTSTSVSGMGVFIECSGGAPAYAAVSVINGAGTQLAVTVAAGDKVSTSVTVTSTKTTVKFKDITKAFSKTVTGAGGVPSVVLDGIDSLVNGTTQLPNPNFGKIKYTGAKMDGVTPKAAAAIAVDEKTTAGVLQISTSKLNTAGNSWTDTFKHA